MSKVLLTNDADLAAVANAIRAKNGTVKALVYPEDYIIGIRSISAASASGNSSISVSDAEDGDICSLTQYGVCEQDAQTNAISCNNGVLSISNGEVVATAANSETLTLGSQTATVENLYSVGSVRDEQEITTGRIVRRNNVCIYDGTQNVGDRYLSSTGAKENGAIIVYPMETEYTDPSVVSFTEENSREVNLLEASITPIQSLNGYSNPWPAGGGKNKLQLLSTESTTSNGVTFTVNADGTVSTQGTASGTAVFKHYITASDLPSGENLILNGTPSGGDWQTKYGMAFCFQAGYVIGTADSGSGSTITPQGLENLAQIQIVVRNGINATGLVFKPMIRLASVADATFAPYANICPISGRTGLNVYDDPKYGGMIVWNQIFRAGVNGSSNGLTFSHDNAWATQTITGTSTATVYKQLDMANTIVGHVYFVDKGTDNTNMQIYNDNAGVTTTTSSQHGLGKATASKKFYLWFRSGSTFNLTIKPMICDLTVMFGSAKADEIYAMEQAEAGSGVAYFKTLFAKEYYPYNAGETTNVSAVDGTTYWKETVDWTSQAGTVYGGTLDVVTGVLTVDWTLRTLTGASNEVWSSYNSGVGGYVLGGLSDHVSENYGNGWCNMFPTSKSINTAGIIYGINSKYILVMGAKKYASSVAEWKTWLASNHLQIVYKLGTPLTYQLTPQEVEALVGQNNIFSPDATSIKVAVSNPVIERVAPQPFTLNSGSNTVSANNLSVSSVPLKIAYGANLPIYDGGVI